MKECFAVNHTLIVFIGPDSYREIECFAVNHSLIVFIGLIECFAVHVDCVLPITYRLMYLITASVLFVGCLPKQIMLL